MAGAVIRHQLIGTVVMEAVVVGEEEEVSPGGLNTAVTISASEWML